MDKEYEVFFIVSHEEILNNLIKYELSNNNRELSNFSERLSMKKTNKEDIEYRIKLFSFSFNGNKKNKIKADIILNGYGTAKFVGKINITQKKNNFIYDFSFDICHQEENDIKPPNSCEFTKNEQFEIFNKLLKDNKI